MAKIKIKGIHRAAKDRLHPEGSLNDMINLRFREGAWEATGDKILFKDIEGLKEFKCYHDLGNGNYAIIHTGSVRTYAGSKGGNPYYIYDYYLRAYISYSGIQRFQNLIPYDGVFDFKISSINNLIVYNTDLSVKYLAFQNGEYVEANIDYSQFACIRESMTPENNWIWANGRSGFGYNVYNKALTWGKDKTNLAYKYSDKINSAFTLEYRTQLIQYLADAKKDMESKGIPVGKCFFMTTIEMYDGTEVAHTPPQFLYAGHLEIRFYEYSYVVVNEEITLNSTMRLSGFCPDFDPDKGMAFRISGLSDVPKGLIKGVKIYITNPVTWSVEIGEDTEQKGFFPVTEYYRPPSSSDWSGYSFLKPGTNIVNFKLPTSDRHKSSGSFSSTVRRDNNAYRFFTPKYERFPVVDEPYYHVGTIDMANIVDGIGYCKFDMGEVATKPTIPVDNNSRHHTTYLNHPVQYNGRMFFSNIKSIIDGGYGYSGLNMALSPLFMGHTGPFKFEFYNKDNTIGRVDYKWFQSFAESCQKLPYTWSKSMSSVPTQYNNPPAALQKGKMSPGAYWSDGKPRWYDNGWSPTDPATKMRTKIFFEVTIADESGDKIYRSHIMHIKGCHFDSSGKKYVSLFMWPFAFPDIRATSVKFFVQPYYYGGEFINNLGDHVWFTKSFPLTQSSFHNFAYLNISNEAYDLSNAIGSSTGARYSAYMVVRTKDFSSQLPDIQQVNYIHTSPNYPEITDPNRVQASSLNNPYVLPAANSYRIGNSEVLALTSVNNEVSQGQFGTYPMVAFTKSGIWAMNIGSGDILISSIVPLANEVVNNVKSIIPIRKGIFFSTEEGLKILQGSQVVDISDIVEGSPNSIVKNLFKNSSPPNSLFANLCSNVDFITYVKNAKVGYDSLYEEIIISNPAFAFSYVFSLEHKMWTKRQGVYSGFCNQFPYLFSIQDSSIYYSNQEDRSIPLYSFFITNPIGQDQFVKIEQLIARGSFSGNTTLYLYGSTDNINYNLIASRQVFSSMDIPLYRCLYSVKSFVILLIPTQMPEVSYFSDFDINMSERYGNKLR